MSDKRVERLQRFIDTATRALESPYTETFDGFVDDFGKVIDDMRPAEHIENSKLQNTAHGRVSLLAGCACHACREVVASAEA